MTNTLSQMKPMEKHRFLTQNHKDCPSCKKNKSLRTFHDKDGDTIRDVCNQCQKKIQEIEITKIVLGMLTKNGI